EDGIRDRNVTGVQTCALPIFGDHVRQRLARRRYRRGRAAGRRRSARLTFAAPSGAGRPAMPTGAGAHPRRRGDAVVTTVVPPAGSTGSSTGRGRPGGHRPGRRLRLRNTFIGWTFILPNFIGFAVLTLGPVLALFYLGFTSWNAFGQADWVGLENFRGLLTDATFHRALLNTG